MSAALESARQARGVELRYYDVIWRAMIVVFDMLMRCHACRAIEYVYAMMFVGALRWRATPAQRFVTRCFVTQC